MAKLPVTSNVYYCCDYYHHHQKWFWFWSHLFGWQLAIMTLSLYKRPVEFVM
jgi:hypothetical protein